MKTSVLKTMRIFRFLRILQLTAVKMLLMIWDRLRGKKILILHVEEMGYIQYIMPIVEALRKNKLPISFYITTAHMPFSKELASLDVSKNRIFHPFMCSRLWMADMLLTPSLYVKGHKQSVKIHISHNLPTKVECYKKRFLVNYNFHFLTGPLHRSQYENMFEKHKIDTKNVQLVNIGYPKSDELLQNMYNRKDVLRDLGLNLQNPTILYAPSWDPGASLRSFGEDVIKKLLTLRDVNLITKLHPVSYTPETSPDFEFYTGGIKWTEKLMRFDVYPNFRHVAKYSINPVLTASDVMITDVSSVALEFIMLDRPVIYLDCPEFFEKTVKKPGWNTDPEFVRNDPRANAGRHVGLIVKELTELPDAVRRSLDNPGEFSEKRKALSRCLLYNPGRGSEAAVKTILELLKM